MSGQEINLRTLTFSSAAKKERAYSANDVDNQLDNSQAIIDQHTAYLKNALTAVTTQLEETKADLEQAINAESNAPVTLPEESLPTLPEQTDRSSEAKIGQLNAANEALRRELEVITTSREEIIAELKQARESLVELDSVKAQLDAYNNAIEVTPYEMNAREATSLLLLAEKTAKEYITKAEEYSRTIVETKNAEVADLTLQITNLEQIRQTTASDVNNYLISVSEQVNQHYEPRAWDAIPEQVDSSYDWSSEETEEAVTAPEVEVAQNDPYGEWTGGDEEDEDNSETETEETSEYLSMEEHGFTTQETNHWDILPEESAVTAPEADVLEGEHYALDESIEILNTDSDSATKRLEESHENEPDQKGDLGIIALDETDEDDVIALDDDEYDVIALDDDDDDEYVEYSHESPEQEVTSEAKARAEAYLNTEIVIDDIDLGDFDEDE